MSITQSVICRVNVPNLAQVSNWHSLVKTSLELQSWPLFQINRRPKNLLGLLPLSLLIWKRGLDCSSKDVFTRLRQFGHIYPSVTRYLKHNLAHISTLQQKQWKKAKTKRTETWEKKQKPRGQKHENNKDRNMKIMCMLPNYDTQEYLDEAGGGGVGRPLKP
jgi:hypothetical protein